MRSRANKYILCFLLLTWSIVANVPASRAQEDTAAEIKTQRNITYNEWNELSNDQDFYYRDSLEYKPKLVKKQNTPVFISFLQWLGSGTGQIIAWSVLILIVAFAVYKIIAGERSGIFGRRSKKEKTEAQEIDEDIDETRWEALLQKAASEGELRMAVRYSYMWLLQLLQHGRLIEYRNDKTNYEYFSELAGTEYKVPFRQLSRQYEYTWYGGFAISQESYNEYIQLFYKLQKQLDR